MAQATLVLWTPDIRRKAARWCMAVPQGSRLTLKAPKRSLPQNDRMWAMLTDIAGQTTHGGRKYSPDQWKVLFMHSCGRQAEFIPALDGSGFIPYGQSSSDLSAAEMTDLIECMFAWGAENGVVFQERAEA